MAIQKEIMMGNGYTASYHTIATGKICLEDKSAEILVYSYKDEQMVADQGERMGYKTYQIPADTMTAAFINGDELIVACERWLMTQPEFSEE